MVEGGERMQIQMNHIEKNKKGVVLLHSDGLVDSNKVIENEVGLTLINETVAKIEQNVIEENRDCGIELTSTGDLNIRRNYVKNNQF